MKPHAFRYYVYDKNGAKIFDSSSKSDAGVWLGAGRYMVRKDLMGNYPDKAIKL